MSEYGDRQAQMRAARRKEARRRRWEDRLGLVFGLLRGFCIAVGSILGGLLLFAFVSSIGIFLGWNLGIYGLAHAVHTHVGHISYWTAFGASFAIGSIRRLISGGSITITPRY